MDSFTSPENERIFQIIILSRDFESGIPGDYSIQLNGSVGRKHYTLEN